MERPHARAATDDSRRDRDRPDRAEIQPLTHVEVGLLHIDETATEAEKVETAATDQSGSFSFPHIRPNTDCWVIVRLGRLPDQGALIPTAVRLPNDGGAVDLGELHVQKGRLAARGGLVFADAAVPARELRFRELHRS